MSSANVLSIQAIEDLKAALVRFGGEAQGALRAVAQEIQRTLDWLAERANHWRNEVRRREEAVRQAEAALARCQASGYRDQRGNYHAPDCSAYQNALLQARVRLREAEAELKNVQQWTQHIQRATAEYQREAQRLAAVLSADLPKASALLANSANILRSYAALSVPSSTGIAGETGTESKEGEKRIEQEGKGATIARKGAEFEAWAVENVFRGKKRIIVPIELNQHLVRVDEEGMGLLKQRTSDNYIDIDGSLWDTKAYDENSVIDRDQLRDYALMERAGYVVDSDGKRVPVTSVNYLFNCSEAAEKNLDYLVGQATAWYVDWRSDGVGMVHLLENQ